MIKIKDIKIALLKFEEAAIKHEEATELGDYKAGNKNYAVIAKVIIFLKNNNCIYKLSDFLSHRSVGVRMWAATYLLPIQETEGLRVLKQIASGTGIHSFNAKITIGEWEKGNLKL
jgi:hypothetical protein